MSAFVIGAAIGAAWSLFVFWVGYRLGRRDAIEASK